jgi:predicted metal-dependent enzyme (double-stranded beta helix superfamily)
MTTLDSRHAVRTTPDELVVRLREAVRLGEPRAITRRVQSHLMEVLGGGGLALDAGYFAPLADTYARRLLHRDDAEGFTVVVMTWGPGQSTPVHDHAGIWCVEGVVEGMMEVTQLELMEETAEGRCRFVERGHAVSGVGSSGALIPPFEYHSLGNALDDQVSVTVHVYGGEMDHCSVFEPLPDGAFLRRRNSLSYRG